MQESQAKYRVGRSRGFWRGALLMACYLYATSLLGTFLPGSAIARTFETRQKALARVFPGDATVLRETVFLSPQQVEAVQQRGRSPVEHERITYYVASIGDSIVGYAYLDTHPVRSMQETLLIVIGPDGTVISIDVLAFHEPQDYLPTQRWYNRLAQHPTPHKVTPGDGIDAISGATLSSRAACNALRRVSSIDHVLHHVEELKEQ